MPFNECISIDDIVAVCHEETIYEIIKHTLAIPTSSATVEATEDSDNENDEANDESEGIARKRSTPTLADALQGFDAIRCFL